MTFRDFILVCIPNEEPVYRAPSATRVFEEPAPDLDRLAAMDARDDRAEELRRTWSTADKKRRRGAP